MKLNGAGAFGSLVLLFLFQWNSVGAQFIRKLNQAQCISCCEEANREFRGVFDLQACKTRGCQRLVGPGNRCDEQLGGSITDKNRRGCEIGRDFLVTGISELLQVGKILQCDFDANIFDINLPIPSEFVRDDNQCSSCCSELNSQFDNGPPNTPEDFLVNTCQSTCADPDVCFGEDLHVDRSACLYALDFRSFGETTHALGIIECQANGQIVDRELTDFPTFAPTEADDNTELLIGGITAGFVLVTLIGVIMFARNQKNDKARKTYFKNKSRFSSFFMPGRTANGVPPQPPARTYRPNGTDVSPNYVMMDPAVPAQEFQRHEYAPQAQVMQKGSFADSEQGSALSPIAGSTGQKRKKRKRRRKHTGNEATTWGEQTDAGTTQPRYALAASDDLFDNQAYP